MAVAQFSGLASGIDSQSLIDALIAARQKKNDIRKKEITDIEAESDALLEFKKKLQGFSDLIEKFRTINGGGIAKKASSIDPSVATAAASSTAVNASYSLTVTSVADSANGSFDTTYTSADSIVSAIGGDITATVGTGADQVIITKSVGPTTTLSQFVNDFNADSTASNRVVASAVNIGTTGTPDFRLVFTTLESGSSKGTLALGSTTAELTASTIDQASNAVFSIGGISSSITRSSNTVSDVVSGLTFSIIDTGTTTISVANDSDKTSSQLEEIVDSYNEIVAYQAENNKVERVRNGNSFENTFGSLAKVRTDDDFLSTFRSTLSGTSSTLGTTVKIFAELGVTTNRFDGTLIFDADDFKTAVAADSIGATELLNNFADSIGGFSGKIYEFTKTGGQIDISIDSNNSQIESISEAIAQLDRQTDKMKERLTRTFTNLESVTARLQSSQQQLTSVLSSLGR
jgi:flagellar hook-associated protein 2